MLIQYKKYIYLIILSLYNKDNIYIAYTIFLILLHSILTKAKNYLYGSISVIVLQVSKGYYIDYPYMSKYKNKKDAVAWFVILNIG